MTTFAPNGVSYPVHNRWYSGPTRWLSVHSSPREISFTFTLLMAYDFLPSSQTSNRLRPSSATTAGRTQSTTTNCARQLSVASPSRTDRGQRDVSRELSPSTH